MDKFLSQTQAASESHPYHSFERGSRNPSFSSITKSRERAVVMKYSGSDLET